MAVLDVQVLARLARAALKSKDYYAYARVVPVLARAFPSESEWLTGYVQCLLSLGLHAAAFEVVEQLGKDAGAVADREELARMAEGVRSGRLPWSSRRRRFQANLSVLLERNARAARAVEAAWIQHQNEFEFHQTRQGEFQIKRAHAVWPPGWLPALDDHRTNAGARLALPPQGLLPAPLIFFGLAQGWEFLEAYARTQKVFLESSSTLYVLEPRPEALALLLHLHDWRELIADPRVLWFVGEGAINGFRETLQSDTRWPITDRVFALPLEGTGDASTLTAALATVAQGRQERVSAVRNALAERYRGRDAAHWAARLWAGADEEGRGRGEPLRILCLTSRHTTFLQYSMRDCMKALERLGHQTRLIIEPSPHQPVDPVSALEAQLEFEPDVIFLLSRMRYEMTGLLHPDIPSVTWDQDQLPWVFDPHRKPQLAWNDFLLGFAAGAAPRRFGWPAHRCRPCGMAGSSDTYLSEPLPESALTPYRCDVSYVSHASAPVEAELASVESWIAEARLRELLREVAPPLIAAWKQGGEFPCPTMTALIDAADARGWTWTVEELGRVHQVLQRLGDRAFRHAALEWVADWADRTGRSFHLYGNGWERHPRLARYARGPTANGEQLRAIYQASTINLQLMGFGFLHQRALDGLMAGAFFMARLSGSDSIGPVHRRLERLLDESGIRSHDDLVACRNAATKEAILECFHLWGADPRTLGEACLDVVRQHAVAPRAAETLPHFNEITFRSAAEFAQRAEEFLADAARRRIIAGRMRQSVYEQFSYDARMKELVLFLREGFRVEHAWAADPRREESLRPDAACAAV